MLHIVIPTPKSQEEYKSSPEYKCLDRSKSINSNIELHILWNNKLGITTLYNLWLQNESETLKENDLVLFLHDDVEIHDLFLYEKLQKAHEQFDIVGLAGATSQNYGDLYDKNNNRVPLVWHLRRNTVGCARGIVSHKIPKGFNGCEFAHYNSSYFGPTPSETVVVDGLFISVKYNKNKFQNWNLDEQFTFHFYDMELCKVCKERNMKIGVWPIFVVHSGLGEFANDPTWIRLEKEFERKYKNYKSQI